jgi:AAA domain, putative AbiEii toxin, Type IV TA system
LSEKLIIRNFGPITNVDLDLRKVNVLIGDQGTGKSTVAKVLRIFKEMIDFADFSSQLDESRFGIGNEIYGSNSANIESHFKLLLQQYELGNYFNEKTQFFYQNLTFNFDISEKKYDCTKKLLDNTFPDSTFFIPTYRDAYVLLRNNYPALLNAKATLPSLLNYFGQEFNNYRETIKEFDFRELLGVTYRYVNGRDLILMRDGKIIKFEESSSAINSVVPMLVMFLGIINDKTKPNSEFHYSPRFPQITIEEPELNCYPTTQKKLVEFLVEKMKHEDYLKSNEYYCNLLLTTHSPYILSTLNNLMFAFNTGLEHFEEVDKIIPSKYWLNPKDVSAYRLNEGGISEEIIDKEGLIKTSKIDEASTILNTEFNKVFDLEFSVAK